MANSMDPDQTAPIGAVCSGPTLFAFILNVLVMFGNILQQTTSADDIFRCIIFLAALRVSIYHSHTGLVIKPGLKVIKRFSCSPQLCMKFQLLMKTKITIKKEV